MVEVGDEVVIKGMRCWAMLAKVEGRQGTRCRDVISQEGHPKLCLRHSKEGAIIPDGWKDESTPIFDPSAPLVLTP